MTVQAVTSPPRLRLVPPPMEADMPTSLALSPLSDRERQVLENTFGPVPVDKLADFYLVHTDLADDDLRARRIDGVASEFDPEGCLDHRRIVAVGGFFVFHAAGAPALFLRTLDDFVRFGEKR